ncbi:MAG: PEP-CTERM sorting domain-containing protein [Planctomycetes bacterium]|nr:PEP-CTERM sorting domain-containing protein [Planctomycetota bacterium]
MRICTLWLAGAAALLMATGSAWAAPIVDGIVLPAEYATSLADATGEPGVDNPGLDINTLEYDSDASWHYFALTVVGPPYDTDGGATSRRRQTDLWTIMYADSAGTTPAYLLDVLTGTGGTILSVTLDQYVGGTWVPVALAPADFQVSVGTALEVAIAKTKMALISNPYVFGQLDDTGSAADDQVEGVVPEPATLALLGLGAAAALASRRRK